MTRPVSLLFGVHAHQPAGNFESVLEHAHARCYRPYLETLYRYPEFKFAIHVSGWLLDYLLRVHPQDMQKLHDMVSRGQAELFGGGDTEPVLASIPERDRRSQITALSDRLEQAFGERPIGAWLTERVWESAVVPSLADSGIRYVTVDDYHFLCAGKSAADLHGYFSTEEGGVRLNLFPISEALRYRIPFATAPEAVSYLESLATPEGVRAGVYFDDIEKFGIWPETYEWVYEKKWLDQFIEGVLRSPLIQATHYRDFHVAQRTRGIVYLPTTSYIEMNEWTLAARPAHEWADLVAQEKSAQRYERRKPFIRGGIWRNFLSRYAEANWAHKRMLGLSQRLAALPPDRRTAQMQQNLHLAQANDAYWHGLFGGLYLPHLRRAIWNALVGLEALLHDTQPDGAVVAGADVDFDGRDEIFLANRSLQAVLRDDGWGAIHELDHYGLRHNFGDTLMRREEHYYRKITQAQPQEHEGGGIASAHDRVSFRHPIGPEDLIPDTHPRALFVDRVLRTACDSAPGYAVTEAAPNRLVLASSETGVTKIVTLDGPELAVEYRFAGAGELETELNLAMPSCDGAAGRYRLQGSVPGGFGQRFEWREVSELILEDDVLGGKLVMRLTPACLVRGAPHHTVSQSEDGFEKIMQAVTLRIVSAGPVATLRIALQVS